MGLEVVFDRIPPLTAEIEPRLAKLIQEGAAHIATRARELIETSPAGGRVYGSHRASAPGEPPASESGELAGSIHATGAGLSSEVQVDSPHGIYQEFGTSKMAPRPFLAPAALEEEPKLEAALPQVIASGVEDF